MLTKNHFVNKHVVFEESLYAKTEPLAVAAKKVMSQIAMVGWTSGGHTAGYVPVFAVGAGSKLFVGKMDNTEIPKRIAKAGGITNNRKSLQITRILTDWKL